MVYFKWNVENKPELKYRPFVCDTFITISNDVIIIRIKRIG